MREFGFQRLSPDIVLRLSSEKCIERNFPHRRTELRCRHRRRAFPLCLGELHFAETLTFRPAATRMLPPRMRSQICSTSPRSSSASAISSSWPRFASRPIFR